MAREAESPAKSASALRRLSVPLWTLGLFTFSGTLGMHIFVPALPTAAKDLNAASSSLQLTVSLYILGLAIGQLLYGPLSDRIGRRPALLAGLMLFTFAGAAAFAAPNVGGLIVARFFQAMGGCAGLVLARAIVRDTSPAHDAARRLALMNLVVTAGPAVAPLIGGAIAGLWGWRAVLAGLCALGVANFTLAWRTLPETRPDISSVSVAAHARDYLGLLISRHFLGYAIGGGCATTSFYAFIACAPFIFVNQLRLPAAQTGLYLALLVSGIWLGCLLATRLIVLFSLKRFLVAANALSVAGAALFLAFVVSGHMSLVRIVASMFIFNLGVGAAAPAALVQAISLNRRVTGSASGLYGAIQMAVGAVLTALAGLGRDPALTSAIVLTLSGLVAQISFWVAARDRSVAETKM